MENRNIEYDKSGMNLETYKQLFLKNKDRKEPKLYRGEGKEIYYYKLSDFIDTSIIDNVLKKEVGKNKNACHMAVVILSAMLDEEHSILTGYAKHNNNEKTLHSVIEVKYENDLSYILDYTENMIMLKKQYIELKEFEEIQEVSNKDFSDDIEKIEKYMKDMNLKVYFTFRDEIMRDLNRNKQLFEEGQDEER